MIFRSYSELITIPTYKERFEYLKLNGVVGRETFGYDRYLNQVLYNSEEWKRFRRKIIERDEALDLGCQGFDIFDRATIHHINPITVDDVINRSFNVFDPDNVITTAYMTHKAIHYGDETLLVDAPIIRTPYDTCPWKRK